METNCGGSVTYGDDFRFGLHLRRYRSNFNAEAPQSSLTALFGPRATSTSPLMATTCVLSSTSGDAFGFCRHPWRCSSDYRRTWRAPDTRLAGRDLTRLARISADERKTDVAPARESRIGKRCHRREFAMVVDRRRFAACADPSRRALRLGPFRSRSALRRGPRRSRRRSRRPRCAGCPEHRPPGASRPQRHRRQHRRPPRTSRPQRHRPQRRRRHHGRRRRRHRRRRPRPPYGRRRPAGPSRAGSLPPRRSR